MPIEHDYKFSLDKPPADTPSKTSLRNQIGPGRYDGFLRYVEAQTQSTK